MLFTPQQLNEMLADGKLALDHRGALHRVGSDVEVDGPAPPILPAMEEYFNDGYHSDVTVGILRHVQSTINWLYSN